MCDIKPRASLLLICGNAAKADVCVSGTTRQLLVTDSLTFSADLPVSILVRQGQECFGFFVGQVSAVGGESFQHEPGVWRMGVGVKAPEVVVQVLCLNSGCRKPMNVCLP